MMAGLRDAAAWWVCVARFQARELWRALPGPWPVKIALIVACALIPGPADEIALLAAVAAWRRYASRRKGTLR
jgi:hypothetical protein